MSKQHFNETYSAKAPENYERYFVPAIGKPLAEDLVQEANLYPGQKVLDVACGTGIVARLASQRVSPNGSVSGLDVNAGMLAVAKSISEGLAIDWYEASAEAIPLQDDSFDVVFCQMGLQFMEDKEIALREMRRVLAPGGQILLSLPGPIEEPFAIMADAMKNHINEQAYGFVTHVFSLHDTDEIEYLFKKVGFATADIQSDRKILTLPSPQEFIWQYIYSTPLASVVSEAEEKSRLAMEQEVVNKWQDFTESAAMKYAQRMVTVCARK